MCGSKGVRGVSSTSTERKKEKSPFPLRLNVLFFAVFLMFSILIMRLGELQIVYGDNYRREVSRTEDITVSNPVPRGKMYDRTGKVVVDNTPLAAITYTKAKKQNQKEMVETAEKLAKIIQVDYFKRDSTGAIKKDPKAGKELINVPVRDMKDFWMFKHPKEAEAKITAKEKKKLDEKELYQLQLKRITDQELASFTPAEQKVLYIYDQFLKGYALTPQIVKRNATEEEMALVNENLDLLPGVDTTTDWDRIYPFQDTLKTVLGKVTSAEEGIPKEQLDAYLARDYSRNDRVGKSYLELEYEDVLHGQKAKIKNVTDSSGNVISAETISDGARGNDLVLTIDMDLQKRVEAIIEEELRTAKQASNAQFLDRAFVVLMNPHTGEVLTMAGKQLEKNPETGKLETRDFALGNITTSYNVGSAVKGATVLTGYQTGAIHPNDSFFDEPIKIMNTPVKKSWSAHIGTVNDLRALQVSSNVYMFKTVIKMGGGHYVPNGPLRLNMKTWDTMRQSFAQFGLGVKTGIDLPNETVGFKGQDTLPGLMLDLAIGQYDTYTPMQMAQYVSTIANGGYRVQPHLVKEIREPSLETNEQLGPVIKEIQPKILNKIVMRDDWIKRVQQGFKLVMQAPGGTAYSYFRGVNYSPAGKTGTAQAAYFGPEREKYGEAPQVINLSLISYAPSDNPEVAMAVLVPWVYPDGQHGANINELIGKKVMDAYFNLKNERAAGTQTPADNTGNQ
jgi:cell division protein FtsI/penicillin-binding protein 2